MAVRIKDLLPVPETVEVVPGKSLVVRGLTLEEIITLGVKYQGLLMEFFGKGSPDFTALLSKAPFLVVDVIAASTGTVGQESDIGLLPPGSQLKLIKKIWEVTVPDPKDLLSVLEEVASGLNKGNENLAAKLATKSGSHSSQSTSLPVATH